jgi:hypothetical protein
MRDEIFGPILPLKTYSGIAEAIAYVNQHERPLALYLFAHDRRTIQRVLTETVSGGVCDGHGLPLNWAIALRRLQTSHDSSPDGSREWLPQAMKISSLLTTSG